MGLSPALLQLLIAGITVPVGMGELKKRRGGGGGGGWGLWAAVGKSTRGQVTDHTQVPKDWVIGTLYYSWTMLMVKREWTRCISEW